MSKIPAWVLRCRVCRAQFGPLTGRSRVEQILAGTAQMDCGHAGADVVSESF